MSREYKGECLRQFPDNYIVVDIETTGFSPENDEIIEIAALKISNGNITDKFDTLVKPSVEISKTISDLTGITNDMVKNAPFIKDVLSDFSSFIGDSILVAYNAHFDINFIYDNFERHSTSHFSNDFIDALHTARAFLDLPSYKLCDISEHLKIECGEFHRALNDCDATFQCFEKMRDMPELCDKKRVNKLISSGNDFVTHIKPAELSKSLNTLKGLITGIKIDNLINHDEMMELINWCSLHKNLSNCHPFSEIVPLVENALADGKLTDDEIDDILYICERYSKDNEFYNLITASIQKLQGIIHGIMSDKAINDEEVFRLSDWLDDNDFLRGTYPFDEIDSLITSILKDHKISEDERNILMGFFSDFIDTTMSYNINEFELKNIKSKYNVSGICSVCPDISIENKSFCFTGTSSKVSRKDFETLIVEKGGTFNKNVLQKTDYLVVGNDGNPCWAFSCYGRKVEKAIELRKKGFPVIIVHENDFWDCIE